MPRRFRLWEKKRGDRRTGSKFLGSAGEASFFGTLFLFGSVSLAAFLMRRSAILTESASWTIWDWLVIVVLASLVMIGASGFVYTILMVGTTKERRRALAKRAADIDLLAETLPSPKDFPSVPRDVNLTNSPGIKLAYRLPITRSPSWQLLVVGIFSLFWNGLVSTLVVLAIGRHLAGQPDWSLNALLLPFVAIGAFSIYHFLRLLFVATAIGPTSIEISHHPLIPGKKYQVYLTQAGRLNVKSLTLTLVCDEEATYRQGTDTRTETRRVHETPIFTGRDFEILPSIPYEHECSLTVPASVMHSFQSDHNAVQWRLVVRGNVEKWSNYERIFPLVVFPYQPRSLAQIEPPAA